MRLDANLRSFILDAWPDDATRKRVAEVLARLPEPLRLVCATRIDGGGLIDTRTLVVTADAIGYGWPMRVIAWRRAE